MVKKKDKGLMEHKKELIICGVFLLALVVCVVFLFVNNSNNDDNSNNEENNEIVNNDGNDNNNSNSNVVIDNEDVTNITEDNIIDAYGVSKEDAKKIVQERFNSDAMEYTAVIEETGIYKVTARNTVNNNIYVFEVDPATKTCVEI